MTHVMLQVTEDGVKHNPHIYTQSCEHMSCVAPESPIEYAKYTLTTLHIPNVKITRTRHPKSERFHAILKELGDLFDKKNQDYGADTDPFANVTASTDWNIPPHVGALLRMNDKVRRLQAWVRNGYLANEGAEDSMRDIAVYAIIALVLLEQSAQAEQSMADFVQNGARFTDGGTGRTETRVSDSLHDL